MQQDEIRRALNSHGYILEEMIGKGGYAQIHLVQSTKYAGRKFAAKILFVDQNKSKSAIYTFSAEVDALCHLEHPNIVKIYDHFHEGHYYCVILEHCTGRSLSARIREKKLSPIEFQKITWQILDALIYCSQQRFAHSDIKPSNILLDEFNRPKLADFGLSKIIIPDNQNECDYDYYQHSFILPNNSNCPIVQKKITSHCSISGSLGSWQTPSKPNPIISFPRHENANEYYQDDDNNISHHFVGSLVYMAPEILEKRSHDPFKSDVWSLGVTLYELYTGSLPWFSRKHDEMIVYARNGITKFPQTMPKDVKDTIKAMVNPDPALRCSLENCKNLPFFASYLDFANNTAQQALKMSVKHPNNRRGSQVARALLKPYLSSDKVTLIGNTNLVNHGKINHFQTKRKSDAQVATIGNL
ncbi:hypothetical protein TRFO_19483 [Tritrichomonas foetus]|uniref:Protein kinase domain-containing protein n=1 Tax=Tritrichomonas foetus TaxID=1144522 RepID=A0A1J4KHX9_9EUKA|nr:hypothetical protein TRFO_19483 [Tritrichomonas foetus]|eukprot:OHT10993.1 hypothetical protein TRFO_19483 [Tritrichomonas foetus]